MVPLLIMIVVNNSSGFKNPAPGNFIPGIISAFSLIFSPAVSSAMDNLLADIMVNLFGFFSRNAFLEDCFFSSADLSSGNPPNTFLASFAYTYADIFTPPLVNLFAIDQKSLLNHRDPTYAQWSLCCICCPSILFAETWRHDICFSVTADS